MSANISMDQGVALVRRINHLPVAWKNSMKENADFRHCSFYYRGYQTGIPGCI